MGNLNENNNWPDGVPYFEANAVLTGGPDCPDNIPIQALADRSRYQRLRGVTPWSATLAYPADAYVSFGGTTWRSIAASTNVQPGADATKWVRWAHTEAELTAALSDAVAVHEAKADPHPVYWNDPRGNAKIAAAVAALVNSSPATLDTLAELATALGNDANFATTVTNALALKAPLASPALTGNPTAPTQAATDNSTRVATTAFARSLFSASPTGNGYIRFASGITIQWGSGLVQSNTSGYTTDITLPLSYSTAHLRAFVQYGGTAPPTSTNSLAATEQSVNTIRITAVAPSSTVAINWLSIGI